MMRGHFTLLFVCTGNLCRSPMAAGAMQKLLDDMGSFPMVVKSAGTHAPVGSGPTIEALAVCAEAGIDISAHKARQLDSRLIQRASLILVMETWQVDEILNLAPTASAKTFLLGSFSPRGHLVEIPDPIGKPISHYRTCLRQITDSVGGLYESKLKSGE